MLGNDAESRNAANRATTEIAWIVVAASLALLLTVLIMCRAPFDDRDRPIRSARHLLS
jgi:hypothetical protein